MSRTSAARFAARARARRWLTLRAAAVAAAVLAVLALAGWVVLASSVLAVREVGVVGADRIDPAEVQALAAGALGEPLARVHTGNVAARVEALPLVRDADVVRAWPDTLEVRLVERVPVAAVPAREGFALVDAEGVLVADAPAAPADLPLVEADPTGDGASLRAAVEVLRAVPQELRADMETLAAATPDDVRMRLRNGAEVVWGSPDDSELKSQVLQALRGQPAEVYDVSAPLTPVTR